MKRGLTHIDWAMSIGLFIIYLVIVFILFKPGITDEYTPDFLSSIIKQGIEENSSITIERTPIFIEVTSLPVGGEDDYKIEIQNPTFWVDGFSTVVNQSLAEKPFDYSGGILYFEEFLTLGLKAKYWALTSDEITYAPTVSGIEIVNTDYVSYAFGVKEKISGIYKTKFETEINNTDYNTLKEQWNYPSRKEFEIFIYEGLDLTNPIYTISENIEPTNEQVNVLQWSEWLINENSSREIITIMVRTW
ncbi:MAG: hypothetical protein KKH88_03775 [Nanoarchaeota archaeon]|nr:hypothetical protein [Nanoarchaeota archaeon]MBU1445523.1 hypothetical protein [Nanoarchaeota archaeon]MBU2406597.1 hypothetical protein [Nanoarchaeota archaeon]MBU2420622.1 hypothetical protein [Nanoarchaeota archaeon]MBU2474930.1 hypothetical protein [Nanoarchaeota archaeon]